MHIIEKKGRTPMMNCKRGTSGMSWKSESEGISHRRISLIMVPTFHLANRLFLLFTFYSLVCLPRSLFYFVIDSYMFQMTETVGREVIFCWKVNFVNSYVLYSNYMDYK